MWLILIEIGFVGFIASLWAVIWRGFRPDGSRQPKLFYYVGAAAFFFVLWMVALPRYPVPFPN